MENIMLRENLEKSAKWAKNLAYITFASVGLSFVQLVFGFVSNKGATASNLLSFIISGVITIILATNLLNFSKYANQALVNKEDTAYFTQSLTHLKNYFMVIGIIFIIMLALVALFFLVFTIVIISKL